MMTATHSHQTAAGPEASVSGTVDTVTWSDAESGYGIVKVRVDDQFKNFPCVGKNGICTIVGPLSRITPGERIQVWGKVTEHTRYGSQISVDRLVLMEPKGYTDLVKYLAKNVKYIDKVLARAIVDKFGENTLSVIDTTPERLLEVKAIGKKRLDEIKIIWQEQREYRQLLMFATSLGIGGAALEKIYDKYKGRAADMIRQDPYRLSRDIWGIGFKKADEIARHLGIQELSPLRMLAAVEHMIDERAKNVGDCFQYAIELVNNTVEFLADPRNINNDTIRRSILDGVQQKKLVADGDKIYLPNLHSAETTVARSIAQVACRPMPETLQGEPLQAAIEEALDNFGFEPAPAQREGVIRCLSNKVSVLTGGPGTGKTSITKAIVHGFEHAGITVTLMAPTGRAAKRMSEVIGRSATTIHRPLFMWEKTIRESDGTIRPEDLAIDGAIVLDECSMIDVELMRKLLRFIKPTAILVFVGDKDQLPSVGPGAVLRDLIECGGIPVTHLTQVFRQAKGSDISIAAAEVNRGAMPNLNLLGRNYPFVQSDLYAIYKEEPEDIAQVALSCVTQIAPKFGFDPMRDCQVLAPMHKGACGVATMNGLLQAVLNPNPVLSVDRGMGVRWGVGDKVMQLRNNYEVGALNGEIGTVVNMDVDGNQLRGLEVDFDGNLCKYNKATHWQELTLAYASTIHKLQGSECPVAIVLLHTSHYVMLQRNLLYTGMTRGKKLVIIVCHPHALNMAIQNNKIARRNTLLADRLIKQMGGPQ